jgi:hypothetical protein
MKRILLPGVACALIAAAPAIAASGYGVNASFTYAPPAPLVNQVVAFTSTSVATGQDNRVGLEAWDLDGDGAFNDDFGTTAARSFPTAGAYTVGLRVSDRHGHSADASAVVTVSNPPPPAPPTLKPFPVVRLLGTISRRGTRVRRLSIYAPAGASVDVRCRGRGCPFRARTRSASLAAASPLHALRVVRVRRFRHRLLRAGVVLKVIVSKPGTIGKYTRFRIQRGRPPLRQDRCVMPSSTVPVRCPSR